MRGGSAFIGLIVDENASSSAEFFAFAPGTAEAEEAKVGLDEGVVAMTSVRTVADAAAELAGTFTGQLLKPADVGYEEARRVHNGLIDKRPALIARCRGVADVADAVNLTRKLGLEVAVRGGGHNVAGRATIDGGLVIDLALMN